MHRCMLFLGAAAAEAQISPLRISRAVCANAGWYTLPNEGHIFPYGLKDFHPKSITGTGGQTGIDKMIKAFVAAPITLLLGDKDTDPDKPRPEIWRATPEAEEQGPHRSRS